MSSKRSINRVAKPVRDLDLRIPRIIQEKDLLALSDAYDLTLSQQIQMADFLNKLIPAFGAAITKRRRLRTRADDRKNLENAIERLSEAQRYLKACGPIGQAIIRSNISHLGEMFSASWIHQAFPKFELPNELYKAANSRSRFTPRHGEQVYIEEHTVQDRRLFARSQNISLVSAALNEIHKSLEEALRRGKKRGGRNKAELRSYFIMNLAEFWKQIGRDPWITGAFEFPQFSEDVLNYTGWPTSGLRPVIGKALAILATRS
jgi:hypothetical protein